tara:strand:+ start:125 stop:337 length:213 start_codon:yes stop_codon:yes gene_type:complete
MEEDKLDIILKKLENIEKKLGIVEESCEGMDNHIKFIEGAYNTLRSPLDYIVNRIRPLIGQQQQYLPRLK